MIKNRTAQLIYQTIYVTLGVIGSVASLGIFVDVANLRWDFYVQFTNLSNFFCLGIMIAVLIQTARKKENSYVTAIPVLKIIGAVAILITCIVFNVLLAGAPGRDPQKNWQIGSLLFHVVLPIMYIGDWILFYERKKMKWYHIFAPISFPFVYMVFILVHAALLNFDTSILIPGTTTPLIYPYFFMNLETEGVGKFALYMFMFLIAVLVIGSIFLGLDRLLACKKKNTVTDEIKE